MRPTLLRRVAVASFALAILLVATRVETARRPQYGGTLRVEIGAALASLDPAVPAASQEEASEKDQIDDLLFSSRGASHEFQGDIGSGPFRVAQWTPGKFAALAENPDFRGGRAFVDSIEIQMGRKPLDRIVDLELNKTDLAEIPPEQARRVAERGLRVTASQPDELIAVVFPSANLADSPVTPTSDPVDPRLRQAIARSIDRAALVNFILQKEGEPAGGLLPQWCGGDAFLFTSAPDVSAARQLRAQIPGTPKVVLGYDPADELEKNVAERIAVNAREAGIYLVPQAEPSGKAAGSPAPATTQPATARLIRWRMPSSRPASAVASLSVFLAALPLASSSQARPALSDSAAPQQIYDVERSLLSDFRILPLVWVPRVYGISARVRDWKPTAPGQAWPLADVWLEGGS